MPDSFKDNRQSAICTLFEGDYHYGLAALVNSLVKAGYAGTVWAGYRGALPPWLNQLPRCGERSDEYAVTDRVRLGFVRLDTETHFTNYKPQFMLDLLAAQARDCQYLWYFDPDIWLRCRWSYFEDWQQNGIALCQEIVNNILPVDSPLRHKWMRIAARMGLSGPRPLAHYFSGGMVGVAAGQASFLHLWRRIIAESEKDGNDPKVFRVGSREMPFYGADQDALNIAAMYTEHPLSTMGPEAMGFVPGGFTMYHAVGPKPWRGGFLRRALAAMPPSEAMKAYFTHVSSPIRAYEAGQLKVERLACSLAALLGRFYRRS
jgi:hypothetical protein